ncbi:MAG: hypothetical protein ACRD0H_01520, partial [Actinomycetes bacterium]
RGSPVHGTRDHGSINGVSLSTALLRPTKIAALAGAVLVSGLVATGCSSPVAGVPAPQSGSSSPTSSSSVPPSSSSSAPNVTQGTPQGGCQVRVGPGNVVISGGGGRAITTNGKTSFSCRTGPLVSVGTISDNSIQLSADGTNATITVSSTVSVGPYLVTVVSIQNGTATLQVVPS